MADGGGKPPRKRRRSRLTGKQKWLIAGGVVLLLALLLAVAYKALVVKPELKPEKGEGAERTEELDYGDGVRPRSDGERKSKDYYTVLIMGRDTGGGGNTDTMLLASYDVTNQKATVMSIPRDTMVNVSWDIKKINSVYNMYGGGEKGVQAVYQEISQLVGFEPDYKVIVEWDAVGEIVEAMGGVYFDVPRNMNYDDPYQDLSIHINKGYQLLNGEQAMGVIRYRHDNNMKYGYADGDLGRIKTQQAFLKAMVEQLLQVKNVTKINQFIQVFQNNVETDLSFQNILWFAQQAVFGGLTIENVNFVTMPNQGVSCWSRSYRNMQSYVVPIAGELLELVNQSLSPFVETFGLSDLDIMSVNSDGSVSSSTGHVEDSRAAVAPVRDSGGSATTTEPDDQETDTPPEGGEPVPPETGGEPGGETTPPEGGEPTPPEGGGETGGETTPPEGGGETTPPGTGGETGGEPGGETGGETTVPTGPVVTEPEPPSPDIPAVPTDGLGQ